MCTTEIGRLALKYDELAAKNVKLATLSADPVSFLCVLQSTRTLLLTANSIASAALRFSSYLLVALFQKLVLRPRWTATTNG